MIRIFGLSGLRPNTASLDARGAQGRRPFFWWPHPDGLQRHETGHGNDNGPLHQNGVLRDFPFVQAIVFIHTTWHLLGSAGLFNPNILDDAYRLHGVWNGAFTPLGQAPSGNPSSFFGLCHSSVRMI
jgi:hypothetical protein